MDEFLTEFITETKEGLDKIGDDLINLESHPEDEAIIGSIFRILHTIKGTCGFIGLPKLQEVSHKGENVLNKIREKKLSASKDVVDLIFECIDTIKSIVATIANTSLEPDTDYSDLLQRLDDIANGKVEIVEKIEKKIEKPKHVENDNKPIKENDSVRVKLALLDKLIQETSELVLTRNQIIQLIKQQKLDATFTTPLHRLNVITSAIQDSVMKTRMQPISNILSNYTRLIRDLARDTGKELRLEVVGEETELDRQILEQIKDPLTHMIRNSADHGIESAEERIALGKPAVGTIKIAASHQAGHVILKISDDGKGLNYEKIKSKVIEKNILSGDQVNKLSETQLLQYIFHPGFSTADKVTGVSGRGVGMDVVKCNVENIGGVIELQSKQNQGTVFTIKIPLTLAIMQVIVIRVQEQHYGFPLSNVEEIIKLGSLSSYKLEELNGSPIIRIRNRVIPLFSLRKAFGINGDDGKYVLICSASNAVFGIITDYIDDIEEIVLKPVSGALKKIDKYSGSSVLGNGEVILVIEPNSFVDTLKSFTAAEELPTLLSQRRHEQCYTTNLLLFKTEENAPVRAVPLEMVSRLEIINSKDIEVVSDQMVIKYKDTLMKLVKFNNDNIPTTKTEQDVIIFYDGKKMLGLLVDEVLDIKRHEFDKKVINLKDERFISGAYIEDKVIEILDISYFYRNAFDESFNQGNAKISTNSKRVLLVDDSAFFRKFIPPSVATLGYEVISVDSVEKAIELLESEEFLAIITDMHMPGKSGLDLVRYCKSLAHLSSLPIIGLSSFSKEDMVRAPEEKNFFDAYIPKTQHSKLLETLTSLVANG